MPWHNYLDPTRQPECDPESEFPCGNGDCIALSEVCDGTFHCHGGEDEEHCPPRKLVSCTIDH